jgi:hypothetical protein
VPASFERSSTSCITSLMSDPSSPGLVDGYTQNVQLAQKLLLTPRDRRTLTKSFLMVPCHRRCCWRRRDRRRWSWPGRVSNHLRILICFELEWAQACNSDRSVSYA